MKLRLLLSATFCLLASFSTKANDSLLLFSPDQHIKIVIQLRNTCTYNIWVDGQLALDSATIDLIADKNRILSQHLTLKSSQQKTIKETIIHPAPENRRNILNHYNQLTLQFKSAFGIQFRAYNDGIAYRILTQFKDSIIVENEIAVFRFPKGSAAWAPIIQPRAIEDKYHTSFEETFTHQPLDSFQPQQLLYNPILIETPQIKMGLTESDVLNYPGMFLQGTNASQLQAHFAPYPLAEELTNAEYAEKIVTKRANYIARLSGVNQLPWRAIIIARTDKELPGNDLVYRLATPSQISNTEWIYPSTCTDEWITDINLSQVPFKSGINTASYCFYIDFAKQFGINRIMMDAGWSDTKNLFKIHPNIHMDSILQHAKKQGVKITLWTLANTLNQQLDSALNQFNKWGIDCIMTDFIDRDDQKAVQLHQRIAAACARYKIMVMFHGSYAPKGFNRTYPNNITREGVQGSEFNAWSNKTTPEHDVIIPFTRMLAGPLDYEPGILDNATQEQFKPIWGKVMSQGTRTHQLALFLVYDSPLQIFSGNPSQGILEPAFMQLLGNNPVGWDSTIVLDAKIGNYVITARKKSTTWYIGGITNWQERTIKLPLNFLPPGNYRTTICLDGINANRNANDYLIKQVTLNTHLPLEIHMAKGGGYYAKLELIPE